MNMVHLFKIIPNPTKEDFLVISKNSFIDLNNKSAQLFFGIKSVIVRIQASEDLQTNEILLSDNIIKQLGIPLYCDYVLNVNSDHIILGPFIGILASYTELALDRQILDLASYVKYYSEIGGIISAFSLDQINIKQSYIEKGYVYNPKSKKWLPTEKIPLPASIFNKCKVQMNDSWNYLSSFYRDKMFNFPTFNKWDMYKWFSKDPLLKGILPTTQLCTHPKEILHFIKKYKRAYLKPVGGTFAKGIMILSYNQQSVTIQFEKKRKIEKRSFYKKIEFKKFFKRLLQRGDYLIQEAINLLTSNDRIIDFRFIYVKNYEGKWDNTGLFARYGKTGSGISNLTRGGVPKEGIIALQELLPEEQIDQKLEEMRFVSNRAASILEEKLTQCGNLGFDFGIDRNFKLWIIEINNEDPDHRIATVCKRKDILYITRLQNMLYAKKLAGF